MIHLALLIVSFGICVGAFCVALALILRYWKPILAASVLVALGFASLLLWVADQNHPSGPHGTTAVTAQAPDGLNRQPRQAYASLNEVPTGKLIEAYRRAAAARDTAAMQQLADALRPRLIAGYQRASDAGDTEAAGQLDEAIRATYTAPLGNPADGVTH
ncbi:hypothetical protein PTKU64_21860 [Paraburkholderia terrae]|uniref:Uncharacterized protein n=1 Tax=Paraburkholderia terrae TaxID=311230 RepID=A0ABN6JCR7_9BURK|nr:hypothetical protein [Paraburkholderia terrae]BCZ78511.1 hypothetical protein PTKU64_21860 [Paraburkholderia terrae]